MRFRLSIVAAAAIVALGMAAPAHATFVTYTTVGTFDSGDSPGTNVYLDAVHGIDITFNGIISNSVTVPPTSSASFGTFDTSATTSTSLNTVTSGFTLQIFQTSPVAGGPLTYVGSLSGKLAIDNSQAFITFAAPLTQSIGDIFYAIASADSGTAGRLNLVPPTTNAGVSTLQGSISQSVPEPASVVLLGLGASAALLFRRREKAPRVAA